jgi:hypothetical protein
MFDGPSELHDRLMAILGLGEFDVLARDARDKRVELERSVKEAKARLAPLLERLDRIDDSRATRVAAARRKRTWDLDKVDAVVGGAKEASDTAGLALLRPRSTSLTGHRPSPGSLDDPPASSPPSRLPSRDDVELSVPATPRTRRRSGAAQ